MDTTKNKTKVLSAKNKISANNILMEQDPDFKKIGFAGKKWNTAFYTKRHVAGCDMNHYTNSGERILCECVKPVRVLEKYLNEGEILIHSKYKGLFLFGKIARNKFADLISKNRSMFETIYSEYPRRLYIDVDGTNSECLTKAKEVLYKIFPKDIKMAISGSVGEKRGKSFYSYHIILPTIVFKNLEEMKTSGFKEFINSQANVENGIDKCVYGNTQQFKAVGQSKNKCKRIQNIIQDDDVENHIIQTFTQKPNAMMYQNKFAQYIKLEIKKTNLKAYKSGKKAGITGFTLNDIVPVENVEIPNIDFQFDPAIKILNHIPNHAGKHKLGRTIMWCIMNWFQHEEGNSKTAFKMFQEWEKPHERNTPQSYQSWVDCDKNQKWWGRQKIQHLLEKIYGCGLPNPRLDIFNKQFINTDIEGVRNTKCVSKYLTQQDIGDEKYCLMKLGMGKGKTYSVIEWLINQCNKNPNLKICWITNRISMALNLMDRLNGNNDSSKHGDGRDMGFQNYKDVGKNAFGGSAQRQNKRHMIRNEVGRIVIELESLHYSAGTDEDEYYQQAGMDYDIVVIDEVESVFNSFRSDTTHGKGLFYDKNYHRFEEIINNASKVFLMDAYLHHRSVEWIRMLEPFPQINLIRADDDKIDKVINNHQSFYSWYNQIVKDIKEGKKLYIFYPFKTGKGSTQKLSIENFKERLVNNCDNLGGEDVLVYHGDMSDKEKQKLSKVGEVWKQAKVIITNSCISVGVNYDYDDFDKVYLSYADILNPRDVIQSSFRVRKTKEDIIEFYRFPNLFEILAKKKGVIFEPAPINKPKLEKNTDAFLFMRKFLMEEYNAKGYETLKRFFKETGYIVNNKWVGGDSNPVQYKDYSGDTLGIWEWDKIKTISKEDKERKESKIFDNTATIDDKLEVRKWYNDVEFKRQFIYEEEAWKEIKGLNDTKKMFYKKPMYLEGFKAIWKNTGVMNHVINLVDGKYIYNDAPLTSDNKKSIEDYLHLTDLVEAGKKHKDKFMKLTDHVIKKKILIHYFGINIMKKVSEWENREFGEFDAKFTEICDITKGFAKKVAPITQRDEMDKCLKELTKSKRYNMFQQGICFLNEDD